MPAGTYNQFVEQGTTYILPLTMTIEATSALRDLTGWTARMMVRTTRIAVNPPILSVVAPEIVTGGAAGTILMTLSAIRTAALPVGIFFYDLEIERTSDAFVERVIQGTFTVDPEVTR